MWHVDDLTILKCTLNNFSSTGNIYIYIYIQGWLKLNAQYSEAHSSGSQIELSGTNIDAFKIQVFYLSKN